MTYQQSYCEKKKTKAKSEKEKKVTKTGSWAIQEIIWRKNKKKEYARNGYHNMSKEDKKNLKEHKNRIRTVY